VFINYGRSNGIMVNEQLRQELLAMRTEDQRVRQELVESGELGGPYVPRMEDVHRKNAARLRELIERYGWPAEGIAGRDGAEAAWLIAQHSVGEPDFQRRALALLSACIGEQRLPAWHAAYLEDRIAMHEGRPQRYGTQCVQDPADGRFRPWSLADAEHVNELRGQVGLGPMQPIPEMGPELPSEQQEEIERDNRWWQQWLIRSGWRQ
jgi:hypothetical protein